MFILFRTRCNNPADAPPWQPWQHELPNNGHKVPDPEVLDAVKAAIDTFLGADEQHIGMLARLGWQCISTHRVTDHIGGCNGARIRCAALLMPQCKYVNSFFYFDVQVA